jgi:putative FmdB family regulatory protein
VPTYQYACRECGERLEAVQKFTDEPLTVCPSCQGRLRKVFSAVGVVFKGSGFYRTDSRAPVGSGANGSGSKSDAKADAKSGEGASSKGSGSGEGAAQKPAGGSKADKPAGASSTTSAA